MHSIDKTIILDEENPIKRADTKKMEVPVNNVMESYIFSCSQSLSLVSTAIDKTKLSIAWLEHSYKNKPEIEGTTPDEFIEYAIENYFIRSGAIYDRCLIFASSLHELGIANESINHNLMVTNRHVIESGLAEKLKSLRKTCTEYRVERNKIVHHGRYSESEFNFIAALHKANNIQKALGKDPMCDQELLDEYTHEVIDIKVDEFQKHIGEIDLKINEFFDMAEKIYIERKERLRE